MNTLTSADWQPHLDKIDVILTGKSQPVLTQNEKQNIVNNWQGVLAAEGSLIASLPVFARPPFVEQLRKNLANIVYDVIKASRGDSYK